MNRLVGLSFIIIGLAACASSGPQDELQAANASVSPPAESSWADDGEVRTDILVCVRERVTGSNRMEKICRYQSEIDKDRLATQDGIRQLGRRNPKDVESQ